MSHDVVSRAALVTPRRAKERFMLHAGGLARSLAAAIAGASLVACATPPSARIDATSAVLRALAALLP